MADKRVEMLNRMEGRKAVPCSKECEYFRFSHLPRACQLSDVFSVRQGEPCYEFRRRATASGKEAGTSFSQPGNA